MKKKVINVMLISIVLCTLAMIFKYDKLSELTGDNNSTLHFNLLTISSIISGFMFTNLGLLISVSEHEIIKKIRNTSIIDKKNGRIISGLTFNIISIFISIIFALGLEEIFVVFDILLRSINVNFTISSILINYIAILEIVTLTVGFVYFSLSVKDINIVLKAIKNTKNRLPDDVIERLKSDLIQD